jgi:hypothetical protein
MKGIMSASALASAVNHGALEVARKGPRGGMRYKMTWHWDEWLPDYLKRSKQRHEALAAVAAAKRLGFKETRIAHEIALAGSKAAAAQLGAGRRTYCGMRVGSAVPKDATLTDPQAWGGEVSPAFEYRRCGLCDRAMAKLNGLDNARRSSAAP